MRALTTVPKQYRLTFNFTVHDGLSKALLLSPVNGEISKRCMNAATYFLGNASA